MGRKPIPEAQRRIETRLYITRAEREAVLRLVNQMRGHENAEADQSRDKGVNGPGGVDVRGGEEADVPNVPKR